MASCNVFCPAKGFQTPRTLQYSRGRFYYKRRNMQKVVQAISSTPTTNNASLSLPLVKICGIAAPKDAELAAEAGADFIGMIMWPHSKRSVSLEVASEISKIAREYGAEPVGVFVDENADTIQRLADASNLEFVQLHGDGARSALPFLLSSRRVVYVLHADETGKLQKPVPSNEDFALVDWFLVDSIQGGSGKGFDWRSFKLPKLKSKNGWLLAGGLNAHNVKEAVDILKPDGVDVSSGICASNGIAKDPQKILSFITNARFVKYAK